MTNMLKTILFIPVILSLPGCVIDSVRTHSTVLENVNNGNLHTLFIDGKTTKRDVLLKLGPPINVTDNMSNHRWIYHFRHEKHPFLLPNSSLFTGQDKLLTLLFDDKGVLTNAILVEKSAG